MKKIILLIVTAMLLSSSLIAQITFTLDACIVLEWSNKSDKYINNGGWIKDNSMMQLNKLETVFTHINERMESAYYVQRTDHEEGYYMYFVISDVGNDYLFMIDVEKELFKIITQPDNMIMTIYNVKAIF